MDQNSVDSFFRLQLVPFVLQILGAVVGAIAVLLVGAVLLSVIHQIIMTALRRSQMKPALVSLVSAIITSVGWILIAAGVLSALNLNQLAIAVGGSITLVALGIATAASGNLGDIIAGIFLASDPDFGAGYTIKTGDITGVIERLDLRKTRIRTDDGHLYVVPNKSIENNVWIVQQRPPAVDTGATQFRIPMFGGKPESQPRP